MAVVRCENGHYYDNSKFDVCPHCNNVKNEAKTYKEESKTIAIDETSSKNNQDLENSKTMGLFEDLSVNKLLAGWLVCTKGIIKGKDFRLYNGWNRLGRSIDMSIYIPEDMKISNKEHAAVVYDNKSNKFFLVNQFATLTYLNDELVKDAIELNSGDKLTIGDTELVFIAFCTEERKWLDD